jgi:hypothetical protein
MEVVVDPVPTRDAQLKLFDKTSWAEYQCAKLRNDFSDLEATEPCTATNYEALLKDNLKEGGSLVGFDAKNYGGVAGD